MVWKYLQNIVMGLYAVCEQKLAHPDREKAISSKDVTLEWHDRTKRAVAVFTWQESHWKGNMVSYEN